MKVRGLMIAVALGLTTSHAAYPADAREKSDVKAASGAVFTEGEIRKVDQEGGKITLAHGEIKSLDMPPMTMVFTVKNPALFGDLKKGDKVRFAVVREDGKFVLTEIEPAP